MCIKRHSKNCYKLSEMFGAVLVAGSRQVEKKGFKYGRNIWMVRGWMWPHC